MFKALSKRTKKKPASTNGRRDLNGNNGYVVPNYVPPDHKENYPAAPRPPKTAVELARDDLELVLREAQKTVEHARKEKTIAETEWDRLCQEERQARDIYEHADPSMERLVRASLKQYWRLAQKRKKAAYRTLQAASLAIEEARDVFEWTLKSALDKVEVARRATARANSNGLLQPVQEDPQEYNNRGAAAPVQEANPAAETTTHQENGGGAVHVFQQQHTNGHQQTSQSYIPNFDDERPHRMFGMFDAKEYLEKMEMEASEVESGDELSFPGMEHH